MNSTMKTLKIQGAPAPKQSGSTTPLSASLRHNRPGTNALSGNRTYQFVLNEEDKTLDPAVSGNTYQSVSSRKMEHLSRVRTANIGISTMDSPFVTVNCEQESTFFFDKPHFVLCGLPVGSKNIDHHLYVNETRVGNYKTSAKAIYDARRGPSSAKQYSEPSSYPEKYVINANVAEDIGTNAIPPMPPTTPINPLHWLGFKHKTIPHGDKDELNGQKTPTTSETNAEPERNNQNELLVQHKKLTLLRRENTHDSLNFQREHSNLSSASGKSIETVKESVVNNSLTVTSGKRAKFLGKPFAKSAAKVNYNNPYRNTKHKERMALSGNKRLEFNSVDSYLTYQKQNPNGRHIMTPRTILRIPKPCSDTFMLQMMYELNRPKSHRSLVGSVKYSDIGMTQDLEEFAHTRTSSSLSKAQSNIDKFMNKRNSKSAKSLRSLRSSKSSKSAIDTETTIEEESNWDDTV